MKSKEKVLLIVSGRADVIEIVISELGFKHCVGVYQENREGEGIPGRGMTAAYREAGYGGRHDAK